jgi:TPR repeat protein
MKNLLILPVLLLTLLVGTPVFSADFQKGLTAAQNGDFATALREWEPLADQGYAYAQTSLGVLYENGYGVPQNYKTAVKWHRLAAAQGYAIAQHNLGELYRTGRGVPQDDKTAVKWYRLAAEQGVPQSQLNLGWMYNNGKGVPQDYNTALKWYRLAAEQGNAIAQKNLPKIEKLIAAKKAKQVADLAAKKAKQAADLAAKAHIHKGYEKGHAQQKFLAELIDKTKSSISKNDSSVKRKFLWIKTSKKLCSSRDFDVTGIKRDWVGYVKIVRMADSGTLSLNVYIDNFDNEVADKKLSQEFLDLALELKSATLINRGDLVKFSGYFKKGDMTENECIDGGIQGNPELTGEVFSFRFTKLEKIK